MDASGLVDPEAQPPGGSSGAPGADQPVRARRVRPEDPRPEALADVINVSSELEVALLAALLHRSPNGVLVVDHDASVVAVNPAFYDMWRINWEEIQAVHGEVTDDLLLGEAISKVADPDRFIAAVQRAYDNPTEPSHAELVMVDGRIIDRHGSALFSADAAYLGYVWFFQDITDRRRRESSLRELAHTDELTGIGNRRQFTLAAAEAAAFARTEGHSMSVAMLDIDQFKEINDNYGHDVGDEILRSLAHAWAQCLRGSDLVARVGGDEFAVLLPRSDREGAAVMAGRLTDVASKSAIADGSGSPVPVSISIGTATSEGPEIDVDHLLRGADEAMYRAKRAAHARETS